MTSISFTTIDADTDIEILSNIEIDGQKIKGKNYILPKNSDSHISLTVNIDAGKDYGYRTFNIFLEGIKKTKVPYTIYMAKKGKEGRPYTRGMIKKSSEFLTKKYVDRAVVLLERINSESSPSVLQDGQFSIFLKYNLGCAYWLNCTRRFVDQCKPAGEIFENLRHSYLKMKRYFDNESISLSNLSEIDIESHDNRMLYLKVKWDISAKKYSDARVGLDTLIKRAETSPELSKNLEVTLDTLKKDREFISRK